MIAYRNRTVRQQCVARRLSLAGSLAALTQILVAQHAAAAPLPGEVSGSADTLRLFVGTGTVASPTLRSASVGCPCNGTNGVMKTDTIASASLGAAGSLVSTGNAVATAQGTNKAGAALSTQAAQVTNLRLLGGLITADAITAKASLGATAAALSPSDDGTVLTNLVIAGTSIDPGVPENTTIPLPGLGAVTVKAVHSAASATKAAITVDGLLVTISAENSLGLAVGTRIVVASAKAGYARAQPSAYQSGFGHGAEVSGQAAGLLDGAVGVGTGIALPSCMGTGGNTLTSTAGALNIPGVASAVSQQATAFGGTIGAALVTKTTSTISDISLLGGLIKADALSAVAQVSRTGNISTSSAPGSGLTGLTVAGVPVPASAAPNLKLSVPGVGYVIANEQTMSGSPEGKMEVIGLDVNVTQANLLGLPVGMRLVLGHAVAVGRKF